MHVLQAVALMERVRMLHYRDQERDVENGTTGGRPGPTETGSTGEKVERLPGQRRHPNAIYCIIHFKLV